MSHKPCVMQPQFPQLAAKSGVINYRINYDINIFKFHLFGVALVSSKFYCSPR